MLHALAAHEARLIMERSVGRSIRRCATLKQGLAAGTAAEPRAADSDDGPNPSAANFLAFDTGQPKSMAITSTPPIDHGLLVRFRTTIAGM
jgi:hypothetical protein